MSGMPAPMDGAKGSAERGFVHRPDCGHHRRAQAHYRAQSTAWRWLIGLWLLLMVTLAGAQTLQITPITWNIIGLDSNAPNTGPDTFPVGARVCNTGGTTATSVQAAFTWTGGTATININGSTTIAHGDLPAGGAPASPYRLNVAPSNCTDFYFNAQITRASSSYDTTRAFQITASASNASAVSTPAGRALYVEHLVSQNRNAITTITGPVTAFIGDTVNFQYDTSTATGGYENLENFIYWPNTVFRVMAVSTTYAVPTTNNINSTAWGEACVWDNTTRACDTSGTGGANGDGTNYGSGKAGGTSINTRYTIQVLSAATTQITGVVHDYSGSSFHYNSDYGAKSFTVTSRYRQSDLAVTKSDGTTTVSQGQTVSYVAYVTNSGPDAAASITVSDPAVAGITKNSVSCSASAGSSCPATSTVAGLEGSGLLIPALSVGGTVSFTIAATITGTPGQTVTNLITVLPGSYVTDSNLANNTATDADRVRATARLRLTKTNGVNTLASGSTTAYTVTLANYGPAAADGAVMTDPAVTGLNCTQITCAGAAGGASCPLAVPLGVPTTVSSSGLAGTGMTVPALPSASTIQFSLSCGVTASGQ